MNVIWIVSDTVRRKDVGVYGNEKIRTPNIDALAAKSVRFNRHYAASFPTMPARADFMTGRWTLSFMQWTPIPPGNTLLAETLKDADINTAACVDTPFFIRDGMNYDRGFVTFNEIPDHYFVAKGGYGPAHSIYRKLLERRPQHPLDLDCFAAKTFSKAMEWLTLNYKGKENFFLYIDTWDPHEPWNAPHYYTEPYWPGYDGEEIMPFYQYWENMPGFTEEKLKKAHASYCGEISMVDAWMGNLLRQVEYMGLMEDTAIIFTTDHGFYFGEHGIFGKMLFARDEQIPPEPEDTPFELRKRSAGAWARSPLYEETAAIPLIIYLPGTNPGIHDGLTSAVDLMPTILDMFELEIPSYVEGKSILPAVKDTSAPGREHTITGCPFINAGDTDQLVDHLLRGCVVPSMATITTDEWSLLYDCEPGGSELYNLKSDPDQLNNVIGENMDIAKDLHSKLVEFMKETNVPQRLQEPRLELRM